MKFFSDEIHWILLIISQHYKSTFVQVMNFFSDEIHWILLIISQHYKSTFVQVMAWCLMAPSHYLNQCWPRSMWPYGITRPQWVNSSSIKQIWLPVTCDINTQRPEWSGCYSCRNFALNLKYFNGNVSLLCFDNVCWQHVIFLFGNCLAPSWCHYMNQWWPRSSNACGTLCWYGLT